MRPNRIRSLAAAALTAGLSMSADASAPPGRYRFPSAGVVYDPITNLLWQQQPGQSSIGWPSTYCSTLNFGGHPNGWKTPTVKELLSLVDFSSSGSPMIDQEAFPNTLALVYWSATQDNIPSGSTRQWVVNFDDGSVGADDISDSVAAVRCVFHGS
jgi:hypothetical protein